MHRRGGSRAPHKKQVDPTMARQASIKFYSHLKEPYGFLSNFYSAPIVINGKTYATTEHYFQACKFLDEDISERVRVCETPGAAALTGRKRSLPLREDWERIKDDVMMEAVQAKFRRHDDLAARLIETGNAELIEHTARDSYWGDGGDGRGKNMLGRILMKVRDELR